MVIPDREVVTYISIYRDGSDIIFSAQSWRPPKEIQCHRSSCTGTVAAKDMVNSPSKASRRQYGACHFSIPRQKNVEEYESEGNIGHSAFCSSVLGVLLAIFAPFKSSALQQSSLIRREHLWRTFKFSEAYSEHEGYHYCLSTELLIP